MDLYKELQKMLGEELSESLYHKKEILDWEDKMENQLEWWLKDDIDELALNIHDLCMEYINGDILK